MSKILKIASFQKKKKKPPWLTPTVGRMFTARWRKESVLPTLAIYLAIIYFWQDSLLLVTQNLGDNHAPSQAFTCSFSACVSHHTNSKNWQVHCRQSIFSCCSLTGIAWYGIEYSGHCSSINTAARKLPYIAGRRQRWWCLKLGFQSAVFING